MHVQHVFREAFGLLKSNWRNIVPYVLAYIALTIVLVSFFIIGYLAFSSTILVFPAALLSNWLALAFLLVFGIGWFTLLIAINLIFVLIMKRVCYLTSQNTAVELSGSSFSSLVAYTKGNFLSYLKLVLAQLAILAVFVLIVVLPALALLMMPSLLPSGADFLSFIGGNALFLFAFIAWVVLFLVLSSALSAVLTICTWLFFMGNEKRGVRWLLATSWGLFRNNIVECILFALAILGMHIAFIIVYTILTFIPCIGFIVSSIIYFAYSFALSVLLFVFLSKIAQPKKV